MKKVLWVFLLSVLMFSQTYAIDYFDYEDNFYTTDKDQVVSDEGIDDPLRDWMWNLWTSLNWTISDKIESSEQAKELTVSVMTWYINYILWLLWLVTLIYLIYHWFIMVSAAWDEDRYNQGIKWIKYAVVVLLWIWTSWFFISLILYLIETISWW